MFLSAILLSIQLGTSINQVNIYDSYIKHLTYESPENAFYIKADFGAELLDFIIISGFMKSYQTHSHDIYFSPYIIDYGIDIYIKYKNIRAGFYHQCDHPVISGPDIYKYYSGQKTELYIKYSITMQF